MGHFKFNNKTANSQIKMKVNEADKYFSEKDLSGVHAHKHTHRHIHTHAHVHRHTHRMCNIIGNQRITNQSYI